MTNKYVEAWQNREPRMAFDSTIAFVKNTGERGDTLASEVERLEAESTRLREAALLALEVISRSGDTTSSCVACMLTLKSALGV